MLPKTINIYTSRTTTLHLYTSTGPDNFLSYIQIEYQYPGKGTKEVDRHEGTKEVDRHEVHMNETLRFNTSFFLHSL